MIDYFQFAFNYLVSRDEGSGYTNIKDDAGGPTKAGVTKSAYEAYLGHEISLEDFQNITVNQEMQFYRSEYWELLSCDKMIDRNVATAIFDSGVLYGVHTVALMAQRAVSQCGALIKIDGKLGDLSAAAINTANPETLLHLFRDLVLVHINQVVADRPSNKKFQAGWVNRAQRLLTIASIPPVIEKV